MPISTKELLQWARVDKRTLHRWKARTGVKNRTRGYWSLRELGDLERKLAQLMKRSV